MNTNINKMIAITLLVMAANMTYTNLRDSSFGLAKRPVEEKVLPIVGRASVAFDGFGVNVGFLVKDGENFKLVRYDKGSMADNDHYQPKYMTMTKFANGETKWDPLLVETFN